MAAEQIAGNAAGSAGGGNWQGVVAGAASSLLGGLVGLGNTALTYKYNKKLAEQQNQFNLDMWNLQNEYNSPSSQMRRFAEAGLNPNLIYGQGSSGNSSSAPQMVTPDAPKFDKAAQELAKAFNIENLLTIHANRKKAQEEARLAELNRFDKEDIRVAQNGFGWMYNYNPVSGRFEFDKPDIAVEVSRKNPRGSRPGDKPTNLYWFNQNLMQGDKNWLIPYRQALLEQQKNYLVPQVTMANYEAKNFPYSFWIGQGTKVANSLSNFIPRFSFSRKLGETPRYR